MQWGPGAGRAEGCPSRAHLEAPPGPSWNSATTSQCLLIEHARRELQGHPEALPDLSGVSQTPSKKGTGQRRDRPRWTQCSTPGCGGGGGVMGQIEEPGEEGFTLLEEPSSSESHYVGNNDGISVV